MNIMHFLTPKIEVAYLYEDYTIRQALEKMEYHRYSSIPVIDREGHYIGTITEGDLLWEIKRRYQLNVRKAEDAPLSGVPRRVQCIPARIDTSIEDLVEKTTHQNFVPVVDGRDVFVGIVKRKDVIRYCAERLFGEQRQIG